MTIILFIIILAVLVFVHELGHFLIAKASGIRVDEFGLGFPPRIFGKKVGETTYTLNAIPFGGFVKIFGEDPDTESISGPESTRSFVNKPKILQAAVLIAGIAFNIIFAWALISIGFMIGLPTAADSYPDQKLNDTTIMLSYISDGSPAQKAGLEVGDKIVTLSSGADTLPTYEVPAIQDFLASHGGKDVTISFIRGSEGKSVTVSPQQGVVEGKAAIGVRLESIGLLKLPFFKAFIEGAKLTGYVIKSTVVGLWTLVSQAVVGRAHLSDVTGPVGIAGMVGDASRMGFVYVLSFTALISVNLAVINLIPFPALDGGRILFVIIESIKRSPIKPSVANTINTVGFAVLIILMLVVTYHDIFRIFVH